MMKKLSLLLFILLTAVNPTFATPILATASDISSGYSRIHYFRSDFTFTGWGLHAWGGSIPSTVTWSNPISITGADYYGVYFDADYGTTSFDSTYGFMVHKGDTKDPGVDQHPVSGFDEFWVVSGNNTVFTSQNEALIAAGLSSGSDIASGYTRIYYLRPDKTYTGWGLHIWGGSASSDITWENPLAPTGTDLYGYVYWDVPSDISGYIIHKGDTKDTSANRALDTSSNENYVAAGDTNNYTDRWSAIQATSNQITFAQITDLTHITFTTTSVYDSSLSVTVTDDSGAAITVSEVDNSNAPSYTIILGSSVDPAKTYTVTVGTMSKTAIIAPSLVDSQYTFNGELGAIYTKASTTFKLWAPKASAVKLLIYAAATDTDPSSTYAMTRGTGSENGVWSYTYRGDADGVIYQYEVTNNSNTNKVLDPYARSMAAFDSESDDKVGKGVVVNTNSRTALTLIDPRVTTRFATYDWSRDSYYRLQNQTQAIIYEMSIRDFTIDQNDTTATAVPANLKGTYLGFIYKIPYLKKLGITHVQLMPVVEWYCGKETHKEYEATASGRGTYGSSYYNWGYDPLNYFTPEGWYASDPNDPYSRIKELRTLIAALHANGIGVILDVVYNHTYNTDIFENIVPYYYYRRDSSGNPTGYSGCGNDCATERSMFRKLMIDSTTYWLREFHVDGFRFDLAGLFDNETVKKLTFACRAINPYVELHGELWNMGGLNDITERFVKGDPSGSSSYRALLEMKNGPSGFSDGFRDGMTHPVYNSPLATGAFIQAQEYTDSSEGDTYSEKRVRTGIVANLSNYTSTSASPLSSSYYNLFCDEPSESVNYTNCHDGYTIWDKICGSCISYTNAQRLRVNKLQASMVLTSQGKVFLHGGEEILRSKSNDSNSYDSPDSINQVTWSNSTGSEGVDMLDYYAGLITLRKAHPAFTLKNASLIQNSLTFIDGTPNFVIAYRIKRTDPQESWHDIIVIHNSNTSQQMITISGVDMRNWTVVVDGSKADQNGFRSADGVTLDNGTIIVPPISTVVIHAPANDGHDHNQSHFPFSKTIPKPPSLMTHP